MSDTQIAPYLNLSYPHPQKPSDTISYLLSIMVPLPQGVAIAEVDLAPTKPGDNTLILLIHLVPSPHAGVSIRTLDVTLYPENADTKYGDYAFQISKDITTLETKLVGDNLKGYNLKQNRIKLSSATPSIEHSQNTFFLIKPHVFLTQEKEKDSFTLQTFLPLFQGQDFHEIIGPYHDLNNGTTYFTMVFKKSSQSIGQIIGKTVSWTLDPAFAHLLKNISISAVQEDPEVSGSTSTEYEEAEEGGNG